MLHLLPRFYAAPSSSSILLPLTRCAIRGFRSPAHTDNLYPGSTLEDRFRIPQQHPDLSSSSSSFSGYIPIKELKITYTVGKDGHNIFEVPTKVDIRFHVSSANWLSSEVKSSLMSKIGNQLSKEGFLVVKSDRTRSQMMNQADALRKLREALWAAAADSAKTLKGEQALEQVSEVERKNRLKASRERLRERRVK